MIRINSRKVETFDFPGGEVSVNVSDLDLEPAYGCALKIEAIIRNSHDFVVLMMTVDAVRRLTPVLLDLVLSYVPYARQDRVCNEGEAFGLKVFADVINAMNFRTVFVSDPHSDVTPALIDRCHVTSQADLVLHSDVLPKILDESPVLVIPDAGAEKKVHAFARKIFERTGQKLEILQASKVRDAASGKILKTEVHWTRPYPFNQRMLIVDDICDGGRTFVELAKELKDDGCEPRVDLLVTHGIFSNGIEPIAKFVDHVYCVNPWIGEVDPRLFTRV